MAPPRVTVRVDRTDPYPLLVAGWGNLVFVFALAAIGGRAVPAATRGAVRPRPLLIAAAGLLGSTLAFVAGIPALALATGGPVLWLYNLSMIGVYSFAWGASARLRAAAAAGRSGPPAQASLLAVAYAAPLAADAGLDGRSRRCSRPTVCAGSISCTPAQTAVVAATLGDGRECWASWRTGAVAIR